MQRYFPDHEVSMSQSQFEAVAQAALAVVQPQDELKQIFLAFDRYGRGFISPEDLFAAAKEVLPGLSAATLSQAFVELDPDRDGRVSYADFLRFLGLT
jgi:Ca2+-binding EF-hand superfamily protein